MGLLDLFRQQAPAAQHRSVATSSQSAAQAALDLEAVSASLDGVTAAEEACAGLLQRAMSLADVEGSVGPSYFDVNTLMDIARDVILRGESVYLRDAGFLRWVEDYELRNGVYRIDGKTEPRQTVFHPRYITDRKTGRGESAMASAKRLKLMALQTETVIENESRAKSMRIMETPLQTANKSSLETAIDTEPAGSMIVTEAAAVKTGMREQSIGRYRQERFGMDTPDNVIRAYEVSYRNTLNALGVMSLFTEGNDKREGIRLTLHTFIKPYARIIQAAAERVGLDIELGFTNLMASDIQAKARAFVALATYLEIDEALEISGLVEA